LQHLSNYSERTMRVQVINAADNTPLIGVVFVKQGTNTGATSDVDGYVELEAGSTYTSHYTGYADNTFVAIDSQVKLLEKPFTTGEVVITASKNPPAAVAQKKSSTWFWILVLILVMYFFSKK